VFSSYPEDVGLGGYCYVTSLAEPPCTGAATDLDVGYWTDTQSGSSGSPVLAYSDHKVVALHHCQGTGSCSSGLPGDVRNLGVPIQDVIASLGADLPPSALCDAFDGPQKLTAVANGDNRIDLEWDGVAGPGITYSVRRSAGGCPQTGFVEIASGLVDKSYSDLTVSGGVTYAYRVVAVDAEGCPSDPSPCDDASAAGACIEPPIFSGLESLVNPQQVGCSLELDWSDAVPSCGSSVTYTVYRFSAPGFTPGPGSLLATCLTDTFYVDSAVDGQVRYSYVVRAEDGTAGGGGPCNGGNQDLNVVELTAAPTGPAELYLAEDFEADDGGLVGTVDWQWGDAYAWAGTGCGVSSVPPLAPHSGNGMWGTVLNGCYSNAGNNATWETCTNADPADDSILSFEVDLTAAGSAELCWWEWRDLYLPWDWAQVTVDGDVVFEHCGGVYTPPSQWLRQCVDVSPYAGQPVAVEFHMMASTTVNYAGWYIDDVEVFRGGDCRGSGIFSDDFESGGTGAWSLTIPLP
jgi:hypothetical protein